LQTVKLSATTILIVTGLCLPGCSPSGAFVGAAGSGDLALFVTQCVTNRGGRASSGGLIAVQAHWTHQARLNEDIILITGDHFSEIETFLSQAYGAADFARGGSCQLRTYSPQQMGVTLNLSGNAKRTFISILGSPIFQKPPILMALPQNIQGGANGRQPFTSETNRTSPAAASRRSP
jgi:hypothetical protein